MSAPKILLCYGAVLVMLFYSLVTNQATAYMKVQTKGSVHFALWTILVMAFLRKVCYDFNEQ